VKAVLSDTELSNTELSNTELSNIVRVSSGLSICELMSLLVLSGRLQDPHP
jgi:hypothetical protein